ncbi:Hypothetical predicted protein [Octopus vulgaris]|uniref:Uncharacterized protein n=1 Tax=Octopus vulgaris TaxID=6645 RepID=A0AA36FDG6_OCTVU|nr:Hypothetical predicted protein [Octopus vulgaris]
MMKQKVCNRPFQCFLQNFHYNRDSNTTTTTTNNNNNNTSSTITTTTTAITTTINTTADITTTSTSLNVSHTITPPRLLFFWDEFYHFVCDALKPTFAKQTRNLPRRKVYRNTCLAFVLVECGVL